MTGLPVLRAFLSAGNENPETPLAIERGAVICFKSYKKPSTKLDQLDNES
jgi:hypothetical protein